MVANSLRKPIVTKAQTGARAFMRTEPRKTYRDGTTLIHVEVQNNRHVYRWRLGIQPKGFRKIDWSHPTNFYGGILRHGDYILCTAYWAGTLDAMVPYKIAPAARY